MKNLVAEMEQKTAHYTIKPEHYRIYLYIAYDKTVIVLAKKDNNYAEWLSIGKLSRTDNSVGECLRYLLDSSPLPTSTSLYWKPYEEHTNLKFEELNVFYKLLTLAKNGEEFICVNGKDFSKDMSGEEVQQLIWQFYEKELEKITSFEEEDIRNIISELEEDIQEITHLREECSSDGFLGLQYVSKKADEKFILQKSKYLFCQDNTIKRLLFELYQLKCDSYNEYMTIAR